MSWYLPLLTDPPVLPSAPTAEVAEPTNQWTDWKTWTAIVGAITGSYGAVVSTLARKDGKWRRAAKHLDEVKPALVKLRNAVAEAQADGRSIVSLRAAALRGPLEALHDNQSRLADSKLAKAVAQAEREYSAILALGDDATAHRRTEVLYSTATAIKTALDRVILIERKSLP